MTEEQPVHWEPATGTAERASRWTPRRIALVVAPTLAVAAAGTTFAVTGIGGSTPGPAVSAPASPLPSQPPRGVAASAVEPTVSPAPSASPRADRTAAGLDLTGLTPGTRRALSEARRALRRQHIELRLTSGHRSRAEQRRLYQEAIRRYGSAAAARRWVLPPSESDHVKGVAVDIAPRAAANWLARNGSRFGLCRTYSNEWWHFAYRPVWKTQGCPAKMSTAAEGSAVRR